jgi:hypothetical protein
MRLFFQFFIIQYHYKMYIGSFKQTSRKMIIADPTDDSLTSKEKHGYNTMIIANKVLKGKWNIYVYDEDTFGMYYVLHENYTDGYNKYKSIDYKWKMFGGESMTIWGRMFGFFDKKFFRNDKMVKGEKTSEFTPTKNPGDAWYNFHNHRYWKGVIRAIHFKKWLHPCHIRPRLHTGG